MTAFNLIVLNLVALNTVSASSKQASEGAEGSLHFTSVSCDIYRLFFGCWYVRDDLQEKDAPN